MLRKSISAWVILIWLSLVLGFLGTARAQSGYDPTVQTQTLLYDEARTVYLGNLARRDNGIPPLRWNLQLTHAARWFSWDSTENRPSGFCGHQDTQGNWPGFRALTFGYLGGAGAENAFCGYVTPEYAINGWMNSSGHRANLLDPNSREIGLGYYRRDSDGRGYVTQDFGNDAVYAPVIIENEAISTTSPDVNLYIYDRSTGGGFAGLGAATQMMVGNNVCFSGASWEPYNASKAWTLENSDGWHEVYVKTRDTFNRTMTVSDTIYLGADVPLNEIGSAQMSTTRSQVTLYNLNGGSLPQVQFSPGWLADDTFGTFNKWWGNGERINDAAAWGGTAYRLFPGAGESFAWVYDTGFIKDTPMVAYFRLKVNNNTSSSEVARISVKGGGTEYGPRILKGTDFTAANQYQEFAVNFTFNTNPDDVFLIFQFWGSGSADVYVDAVSIFSAPQAITSPLTWSVPGNNYRGQGVWVRYTNGTQFSALSEAVTTQVSSHTISGNAGVGGAILNYTDGIPKMVTADGSGNYSITVPACWSGTVTPSKVGNIFVPASRTYANVVSNQTAQNYAAFVTISGNTGTAGATLSYTNGSPKTVISDGSGNYTIQVPSGWSGIVTPSKDDYTFTPVNTPYTNVLASQTNQNYIATDIPPSVLSIARVNANPTNASSVNFTVTFSEPVTGVDQGDFALATDLMGTSIIGISGSDATRTVVVNTGSGSGTIRLDVHDNNSILDNGSNPLGGTGVGDGDFTTGAVYDVDKTVPTVSMSSTTTNPTNVSPITVTVTFSESVTGFTSGDIIAGNGIVNNFAGSGASYTFNLAPVVDGLVTANIAASVAQDLAGNNNTAAVQFSRTYDTTAPTVSMSSPAANSTNISPIAVTVTFSESVTGFTSGGIVITNGTLSNFMGSGASYTFDLTPSMEGLVTANIAGGAAQDFVGYNNTAAAQFSRTYDVTAPTVSAFMAASPLAGLKVPITTFTASDNIGVAGYIVTETSTQPASNAAGWNKSTPKTYICKTSGTFTLYPWAKDAAGNVSAVFGSPVSITLVPSTYYSNALNDGWTLESSEFSSVASTRSVSGTLRVGDDARNRQYRSLLYFDTASLPNNAVITKVTVQIKKAGITGDDPFITHGNLVADMRKGFFGLNKLLELSDFNAAAAPININTSGKFTALVPTTPVWYQLTFSPSNFKYVNLLGVTQFRLRFTKDDNNDRNADFISFYAGDAAKADQPQLIIEYWIP